MVIEIKTWECVECRNNFFELEDEHIDECPHCGLSTSEAIEINSHTMDVCIDNVSGDVELY